MIHWTVAQLTRIADAVTRVNQMAALAGIACEATAAG